MAITSFYHAIYKRLWAVARAANAHMDDGSMDGGFTLRSPGDMHGIFGKIMPGPGGALANQSPLGNNVADNNPIYRILLKSLDANPQLSTQVNGQTWPVMPFPVGNPPSIASYPFWVNANKANNPPRLIDKLKEWIEQNNKTDDTPGGGNLDFAHWSPGPAAFPVKDKQALLVCSIDKDNGVRPGNVPANYWNTSQIFVCDDKGKNQGLPVFKAGTQHTIQAIIGNSGNLTAGVLFNLPPLEVRANAYVWNTFLSPSFPLPALSALDANNAGPTYEQPGLVAQSYAVAGFRFDVDVVFKGLHDAMVAAGVTPQQLGGLAIDEWLKANNAHACVKVLIRADDFPDTPNGGFPSDMAIPAANRHIAQRNLAGFDMTVKGAKKIEWQTFMMSQADKGLNALAINAALPADAVRFYFAIPTQMFERYLAPQKGTRGFERVTDIAKPFPDAVILRRTNPGARLEIADHAARDKFFGMALGVEWEPPLLARTRELGDISVAHTAQDGTVMGGFTLRPQRV